MFGLIKNYYKGKKILIIGHTGFKGSWLTLVLKNLGAKLYGISIGIPSVPSNYLVSNVKKNIKDYKFDIRNIKKLKKKINSINPDIIFNLAAQSLVRESFKNPYYTWSTNLIGSLNLLEILKNRKNKKKIIFILITSDKCYKNVNKTQGYKEDEVLGGHEPYGASKASVELLFHSYFQSFFVNNKKIKMATARAGNVIGGGDWSKDRIIPDLIKKYEKKQKLFIRYPESTRPWQHVLDPVFGYIYLGYMLNKNPNKINGESFNFGPYSNKNYSVKILLREIKKYMPELRWNKLKTKKNFFEAGLLNLNSKKTLKLLNWKNKLNFKDSVKLTTEWYIDYFAKKNMQLKSFEQIQNFKKKLN
ncbi:CDP-glucose 4,6-dehydratase [Candidatus Pelagibacter sp.]|nr:CDP-glucose 4,6-dehydratase [Candidatus Pelagibacter sp.]